LSSSSSMLSHISLETEPPVPPVLVPLLPPVLVPPVPPVLVPLLPPVLVPPVPPVLVPPVPPMSEPPVPPKPAAPADPPVGASAPPSGRGEPADPDCANGASKSIAQPCKGRSPPANVKKTPSVRVDMASSSAFESSPNSSTVRRTCLSLGQSEAKARRFWVSRGERGEGALRKPP